MKEEFKNVQKSEESAEEIIEKFRRAESEPLEIIKANVLTDTNVEIKIAITTNRWPNPMGKDRSPLLNLVGEHLTRKGWLNEKGKVVKPFGLLAEGEFIPVTSMPPFDLNNDGTYTGVLHYVLVESGSRRSQDEESKRKLEKPPFPPDSPGYNE